MSDFTISTAAGYINARCTKCDIPAHFEYDGLDPTMPKITTRCEGCGQSKTWKLSGGSAKGFHPAALLLVPVATRVQHARNVRAQLPHYLGGLREVLLPPERCEHWANAITVGIGIFEHDVLFRCDGARGVPDLHHLFLATQSEHIPSGFLSAARSYSRLPDSSIDSSLPASQSEPTLRNPSA
jgi:hypothetical protein